MDGVDVGAFPPKNNGGVSPLKSSICFNRVWNHDYEPSILGG